MDGAAVGAAVGVNVGFCVGATEGANVTLATVVGWATVAVLTGADVRKVVDVWQMMVSVPAT